MNFLYDSAGRHINYLRVAVTDRCNFHCQYCMPQQVIQWIKSQEVLGYNELLRIIKIFVSFGVNKIRITGGEPLVRKGIIKFIEQVTSISGVTEVSMTTNGSLLGKYASSLKAAGLNRINISLDTLDREQFYRLTGRDKLETVLKGIQCAEDSGFAPIKINMVVIRNFNENDIAKIAAWTIAKAYQVRFIEYMPFIASEQFLITKEEMIRYLKAAGFTELIPMNSTGVARNYKLPNSKGTIGFITPVSQNFCNTCNRIRLTADGYLKTCLFSEQEYSLRELLKRGYSDEQIAAKIKQAVAAKPLRHYLEGGQRSIRIMSRIGG